MICPTASSYLLTKEFIKCFPRSRHSWCGIGQHHSELISLHTFLLRKQLGQIIQNVLPLQTAITISAPIALATLTGTGSTKPQSTSQRFFTLAGAKSPGVDMLALRAAKIFPDFNTTFCHPSREQTLSAS